MLQARKGALKIVQSRSEKAHFYGRKNKLYEWQVFRNQRSALDLPLKLFSNAWSERSIAFWARRSRASTVS